MKSATSLLALCLGLAAPIAVAAPPDDAEIEPLLRSLELPQLQQDMMRTLGGSAKIMGDALSDGDLSPSEQARLDRLLERQGRGLQDRLAWEKVGPIYRHVLREAFNSEEFRALTAPPPGPNPRSNPRPAPNGSPDDMSQMAADTLQAMQPMLQAAMTQFQRMLDDNAARPGQPLPFAPSPSAPAQTPQNARPHR